jgi:hypothetical protein
LVEIDYVQGTLTLHSINDEDWPCRGKYWILNINFPENSDKMFSLKVHHTDIANHQTKLLTFRAKTDSQWTSLKPRLQSLQHLKYSSKVFALGVDLYEFVDQQSHDDLTETWIPFTIEVDVSTGEFKLSSAAR